MEFMGAGSVADLIKKSGALDEKYCKHIVLATVLALEYLHSNHRLHRDIKGIFRRTANIFESKLKYF